MFIDKDQADQLSKQVNDAVNLLTEYNQRLANEMDCRKKVATMLRDFLQAQKELLAQAEQRLEVCNNLFFIKLSAFNIFRYLINFFFVKKTYFINKYKYF